MAANGVCDAGPVARFCERVLGFEIGDFEPPDWAQLWDPAGGVHINIQGETWYQPPTWPERPGEQAKMLHFEVEVDDLGAAVTTALEAGGTQAPWQPPDRNPERFRVMARPRGAPALPISPGRIEHSTARRSHRSVREASAGWLQAPRVRSPRHNGAHYTAACRRLGARRGWLNLHEQEAKP